MLSKLIFFSNPKVCSYLDSDYDYYSDYEKDWVMLILQLDLELEEIHLFIKKRFLIKIIYLIVLNMVNLQLSMYK